MGRILVVDDEECIRYTFDRFLTGWGHEVSSAGSFGEALAAIGQGEFDLIFADIILSGKTGLELLRECRERGLGCPVVIITGYPEVKTASEAVRLGAFDYIPKPVEYDALRHITVLALQHKLLHDEKERYRARLDAIFRSVDDAIFAVDNSMRVTEINDAARTFCGLGREAVGKDVRSLELGCTRSCLEALEATIQKRQAVKARRIECRHHGNPTQVVSLSTYPLMDRPGVFSGAVMVMRDETRLVRLERDLGERRRMHNILGQSRQMQKIYRLIETLADVESTVLITGESGTGKELVAEALHCLGGRRHKPLVRVNCSALSESLLESELFGHVKGAFTGAVSDRIGRFQRADGGTIFLDEIGDLSRRVQASLLRVLQKREFERVGDSTPIRVNARVITATNRNLHELADQGEFREDLLYRLEVVELRLPPLRDRREDIPVLVEHFLGEFNQKLKKEITGISTDVENRLMEYAWPGNVRELEHALEHAAVLCDRNTITFEHLPLHLQGPAPGRAPNPPRGKPSIGPSDIARALEQTAGNKKRAARMLGIDRKTLYRNLAKLKTADSTLPPSRDAAPMNDLGDR